MGTIEKEQHGQPFSDKTVSRREHERVLRKLERLKNPFEYLENEQDANVVGIDRDCRTVFEISIFPPSVAIQAEDLARLEMLINEYLDQQDEEACDEYYGTSRDIHEIGLEGFLEWLKNE